MKLLADEISWEYQYQDTKLIGVDLYSPPSEWELLFSAVWVLSERVSNYCSWHVCDWLFPEWTKHKATSLCLVDAGHTLNCGLVFLNELNGFQRMMCWAIWDPFLSSKWWKDFQVVPNGPYLLCLTVEHSSHLESIYKIFRLWHSHLLLFNLYFDAKHYIYG